MHKLRVGVLRGGPSSEYDISLKTGASVLKHMPEKYVARDILITKDGTWHLEGLERKPNDVFKHVDVVFNALHGEYGEDGKVQKLLDHFHMPYTGSGSFSSALSMAKHLTKKAFAHHGIKTPRHVAIGKDDEYSNVYAHVFYEFTLPFVVKPASVGSSVGVTIVKSYHSLKDALDTAFAYSDVALVEEYIRGKEATCGVVNHLRGESTYALLPVEIIHPEDRDFFDYEAKYSGCSREICPGNFREEEKSEIQQLAKDVHDKLGLRHYSRTDFIIHPKRGAYVLEVNTLPGLTTESLLPKSLDAIGVAFPEFLDHLLTLAVDKR